MKNKRCDLFRIPDWKWINKYHGNLFMYQKVKIWIVMKWERIKSKLFTGRR